MTEANLEIGATGVSLQAMDSSHVSLVALSLRSDGFEHYRADRAFSMGMNLNNVSKMLRCAGKDDIITIKADDGDDTVYFTFESPSKDGGDALRVWLEASAAWVRIFCTLSACKHRSSISRSQLCSQIPVLTRTPQH